MNIRSLFMRLRFNRRAKPLQPAMWQLDLTSRNPQWFALGDNTLRELFGHPPTPPAGEARPSLKTVIPPQRDADE